MMARGTRWNDGGDWRGNYFCRLFDNVQEKPVQYVLAVKGKCLTHGGGDGKSRTGGSGSVV